MNKYTKLWITLGIILGILVLFIVGGLIFANHLLNSTLDQMVTTESINREEASVSNQVMDKEEKSNVVNIAVFGLDQDGGDMAARSDAMKVLSLDINSNAAKITSLQRDTLIYIPGEIQDFDKLNHAYAYGGAKLAMQTINYNFDLDLTRYVTFNFGAIEHMIDTIGGVDINVQGYEVSYTGGQIKSAGLQTLNGSQALAYMRIRKADSDYVRMERQTNVMKAIFSKLKDIPYTQLLTLLNEMLPYIETNLTKQEIIDLGLQAIKIDLNNINQYQIPIKGYQDINHSVSYKGYSPLYVMNSYQQIVKELHQNIYGDEDYQPSNTIIETEALIYETFGYNAQ